MKQSVHSVDTVHGVHPVHAPAINREAILAKLQEIYDPELSISIVDLGLVYDIEIQGGHVALRMTMTSRGCPMHEVITDATHYAIRSVKGVESVDIQLVWEPPWNPEMLSPEAKAQLGG
jgi:metal-sulfur cluster biosynthetic enzyme